MSISIQKQGFSTYLKVSGSIFIPAYIIEKNMTRFNIDDLKKKIRVLSGEKNVGGDAKFTWWKPTIGNHDVRFLPLKDGNGEPLSQPFFEVAYYEDKDLSERRFPTNSQYGLADPIRDLIIELAKDRSDAAWKVRKKLNPRERYYAALIVRGEEDKGPQVWELSPKVCREIYSLLVLPDYEDEDLFDPTTGFDFTISVTPTDKTYNGHPVKDIKPVVRRKSSRLHANEAKVKEWLNSVPNFEAFFKKQVKTEEELIEIRDNFLVLQSGEEAGEMTSEGTSRGSSADDLEAAVANVNAAFADMDD